MTVYVVRNGVLVEKDHIYAREYREPGSLPLPMLSRFESFESPITGETISSWRQRDADMQAGGAVDPRDLPREPFERRAADNARREQPVAPFEWRDDI
jgi:hypothetical protein